MRGHRLFGFGELDDVVLHPPIQRFLTRWRPGDPIVYLGPSGPRRPLVEAACGGVCSLAFEWGTPASRVPPSSSPFPGDVTTRLRATWLPPGQAGLRRLDGGRRGHAPARPRRRAPGARARPAAARARPLAAGGARAPARAASRRATGCAAAAGRAGTCRSRGRRGSPRSRSRRRCRSRATTRPSGSAPASSSVRPAWFSKPGERPALARLELALEQHVADHPPLAGDRHERQQADARAARRRHGRGRSARAAGSRRTPRARPRRRRRPPRSAAALARRDRGRRAPARGPGRRRRRRGRARRAAARRRGRSRATSSSWPRQRRPPREHGDVPAVGVDVQVLRVQVADDDLHARGSQYGRTWPRAPTILRSASIAV